MTLLRAMCVLLIVSGIAGVAAGEESATGGWWLILVFSGLLALTFIGERSSARSKTPQSRTRSHLIRASGVVLAVLVLVPFALFMLAGGR